MFFEQSFRLYEKAVALFPWPSSLAVWLRYLATFHARFEGTKLERSRDLFDSALATVPSSDFEAIELLSMMYAEMEERHGAPHRIMRIYAQLCGRVRASPSHLASAFRVRVARAIELFGYECAREVLEEALNTLQNHADALDFSVCFASMEEYLGEYERARKIFMHGAQMANPASEGAEVKAFWTAWRGFEARRGSQETFRDMMRQKRAVGARFSSSYLALTTTIGALREGRPGQRERALREP